MKNYTDIAIEYAEGVVAGDIPNCRWVIACCQRFLDDLKRDDWRFHYSDERAAKFCKFAENLPHIKGQWAGTDLVLEPWQVFIACNVFGWIDEDGNRRFRTAYLEVPRKNGKTFLMSAIGLYMLLADGEAGAEVYSAAVKKDQARLVWDTARRQVLKTEELQQAFNVEAWKHSIFVEKTASSFLPLASDSDSLDGLSVHAGLIDELHAHKSREVFDVIETGTGSRAQSLMFIITTAGSNQAGICYEQRGYVTKLLEGVNEDESYFGIIYTLDDDDIANVWDDRELWKKANPNYGVSVLPFDLERLVKKAKQTASAQNNVLTKRFNVWTNADTSWMDMWKWNACQNEALSLDDFKGEPCIMGADFASKIDIAALCLLFERDGILYPFLRYYLPDETVRDSRNDQYHGWWKDGLLTVTPGQIIDFDYIEQDCSQFASEFEITEFAYDPFQATQFAGRMLNEGWNMTEVRPTVLNFSEPMKELEARVISETLQHNDPVLSWMVSNTVCHLDAKDNIYPRKEKPENKIDGVIALLSAMNRYMNKSDDDSIYLKRGLTVV
jgi:phage terminase large subunit-like protein